MSAAAVFAAVSAAYAAGHWVGDYWVQTHRQARGKAAPGWPGRRGCAAHVATYTLTLAACLALAWWRLALPLSLPWTAAGLAVSAVTHYAADRRRPLRALAAGPASSPTTTWGTGSRPGPPPWIRHGTGGGCSPPP